ncbi:maleylacetoacetate isomerase-like [Haliotis rubra]|uniref:maleylacetoacetate isomerase-like n=1 Tax=Haliotis rubra TaxID=36100 RepID=UPI001EE55935|nr:maleylacetoacetate isomerase-like [Haliotis rubra]
MSKMMILYGHSQSSCTWRVRIALAIKGMQYEEVSMTDDAMLNCPAFLKASPLGQVPALIHGESCLTQSIAIIEYLEEIQPNPRLLPVDPVLRAKTRALAETVVSSIQPYQGSNDTLVSRVGGAEKFKEWAEFWINRGFAAIEVMLKETHGKCCVADDVTVADLCMVPQYNNAVNRYNIDVSRYPTMSKIADHCLKLEPFSSTRPAVV